MKLMLTLIALLSATSALAELPQVIGDLQPIEYKNAFDYDHVKSYGTELIATDKIEVKAQYLAGTTSTSQEGLFAGSNYIAVAQANEVSCSLTTGEYGPSTSIPKNMRFVISQIRPSTMGLGNTVVPITEITITSAPRYRHIAMVIDCSNVTPQTRLDAIFAALDHKLSLSPDPKRVHSMACIGGHDILGGECVL